MSPKTEYAAIPTAPVMFPVLLTVTPKSAAARIPLAAALMFRKRVFYRTGYARGWPRRRVTPGPSSVIGTAWLT
ncbi:hypothetical protein ABIA00_004902 [Bradyrhizobium ottawaense]|uniref:hypothetical protein n=1 Tax=Bradyrhizobium ottawaense TaxID=931866 RepID=UPI00383386F2